jgi:hypothetical protein
MLKANTFAKRPAVAGPTAGPGGGGSGGVLNPLTHPARARFFSLPARS